MLTLKYIRDNVKTVQESLSRKQSDLDINQLLDLDVKRRECLKIVEELNGFIEGKNSDETNKPILNDYIEEFCIMKYLVPLNKHKVTGHNIF